MGDTKVERDRSPRRDRRSGGGGGGRGGGGGGGGLSRSRRAPPERRIFVSNIPFEMKWQEVKDMFREQIGDVTYVELFSDENEKPRGCGILEFGSEDLAKKAVEKMHRYDLKGRKLVVKEDFDTERDRFGKIVRGSGGGGGGGGRDRGNDRDRDRGDSYSRDHRGGSSMGGGGGMGMGGGQGGYGKTYGLSPNFLESLGIDGPLHTRLFVANLSYTVDEKKLREVFRLAGRVVAAELNKDKDNKSRGHGVIEYSHPVEAVQAISMFNNQTLYERKMTVRFDKQPGPTADDLDVLPSRLPEGLEGVGMGLGSGGNPLTNVAQNLPSAQAGSQNNSQGQQVQGGNGMMGGNNGMAGGNMGGGGNNMADLMSNMGNLQALARMMGGGAMGGNPAPGGGNMGGAAMGGGNMGAGMAGGNMGAAPMASNMGAGMMGAPGGAPPMGGANMGAGMMGGGPMGAASAPAPGGYSSTGYASSAPSGAPPMNRPAGNVSAPSSGLSSSDTVLIRGLPQECNWQALREGFSHCGDIKYAEMKERGTGLIRFTNERDAERAVSMMDKHNIGGRTIEVRLY